jgi:ribosome-associated toxin RatA of RatAB toxin-antitoxin module
VKKIILALILLPFLFSKESIKITRNIDKNNLYIVNATAIMYLDQNIDSIFKKIVDFSNYDKTIEVIDKSEVYYNKNNIVKLKMTSNILHVYDAINHFIHKVDKDKYQISWKLDKNKDNILKYSKGGWKLEKLSPNRTKVTYDNSIKAPSFMPLFISKYIIGKGVEDSTLWLMKNP